MKSFGPFQAGFKNSDSGLDSLCPDSKLNQATQPSKLNGTRPSQVESNSSAFF